MRKSQFGLRLALLLIALTATLFAIISARVSENRAELSVYRMEVEARITRDRMQQSVYRRDEEAFGRPAGFYDARIAKLEQRINSNRRELKSLSN